MYVFDDSAHDDPHDDSGTTAFWCLKTMTTFGPDDELVARLDCRDPSRPCYEPT